MKRLVIFAAAVLALGSGYTRNHPFDIAGDAPHPRLIMGEEDFSRLRDSVRSFKQPLFTLHEAQMLIANQSLTGEKPAYVKDASGRRLLVQSRLALKRIFSTAYAYRMTGDDIYLNCAEETMNIVCDFPDWNPTHYLDVAEMAAAVAIGYDWLFPVLQDSTRAKAVLKLQEYAFKTSENRDYAWFYDADSNWNQVCNAGLVCAAIATFEFNPEDSRRIIRDALASNKKAIGKMYAPDGNYPEGPVYWDYGGMFQALLNTVLENSYGTDFGLSDTPGFDVTGKYILHSHGNAGRFFNFSDNNGDFRPCSAQWYFAKKFDMPEILYAELDKILKGVPDKTRLLPLFVCCAVDIDEARIVPPSEKFYKGNGATPVVMCRTGWTKDDLFLGIKGGTASTHHAHMDAGSFVFSAYGVNWGVDMDHDPYHLLEKNLGTYGMNLWDMKQESARWRLLKYNNLWHNTLTIGDSDHSVEGFGRFTAYFDSDTLKGATLKLDGVYDSIWSWERTATISGDGLRVADAVSTLGSSPAHIRWTLVGEGRPAITDDGILLKKNGVTMLLHAEAPAGVHYRIWSTDPRDYDTPYNSFEPKAKDGLWICGFETDIPKASDALIETRLQRVSPR